MGFGKTIRFIEPLKTRVGTDSSLLSTGVNERPTSPIKVSHDYGGHNLVPKDQSHDDEHMRDKRYGRHGDINPSNILWYDDSNGDGDDNDDDGGLRGTLKISDFGQAEINSLLSKTSHRAVADTMTYRPPECEVKGAPIRQSFDIWCLGCVYLEFATWLLGGAEALAEFGEKRRFRAVQPHFTTIDTFYRAAKVPQNQESEYIVNPKVTKVRCKTI